MNDRDTRQRDSKCVLKKTRRIQFTLGSMFLLIAVVSVVLAWNVEMVRKRSSELQWISSHKGVVLFTDFASPIPDRDEPRVRRAAMKRALCPMMRVRFFGDRAVDYIYINVQNTPATWEDRERVAMLFPEAEVMPERPESFSRNRELLNGLERKRSEQTP